MKESKEVIKALLLSLIVSPTMKAFVFFEKMFGMVLLKKIKKKGGNCIFEGFGRLYKANNIKMGEQI